MPVINNMPDDTSKKNKRPTTRQGRKDRTRAKKKSHKLTERHVAMIRSQKGKQSVREICKWFARQTHYVYKVSPGMVSLIHNNKAHKPKGDTPDIYDMILAAQEETEEEMGDTLCGDTEEPQGRVDD
tara:strand:- start:205 stop:585 length:381 start_codon:yes stop_codon:yes gene_type:complete